MRRLVSVRGFYIRVRVYCIRNHARMLKNCGLFNKAVKVGFQRIYANNEVQYLTQTHLKFKHLMGNH